MAFDDSLLVQLSRTQRDLVSAFGRFVGMSPARVSLLVELDRWGERSQADLQRYLGVNGAVVTRQVKAMEADGLLVRRPNPADNRFTLVTLTDQGRQAVAQLGAKQQVFEAFLLAGMPDADKEGTRRFLQHIRKRLPAVGTEGAD